MPDVVFAPRYMLRPVHNPDMDWLRSVILEPFHPGREFGEASITFRDGEREVTLILIADAELGYYLKYDSGGDPWLSLGDRGRLTEVVCPDDWQVSAGLFIPPEQAWCAIREFCQSGTRSGQIEWIRPEDVPEDGNW